MNKLVDSEKFWQRTPENVFEYFDGKLGWKAWENGTPTESMVDLDKDTFLSFWNVLNESDKDQLFESFANYDRCMSAVVKDNYPYAFAIQTIALMATIESVMRSKQFVRLNDYLLKQFLDTEVIPRDKLNDAINSYHKEYAQRNSIFQFFTDHLSAQEKTQLLNYLKSCPEWESCDSIKKFVDQVNDYRHKFVHELSDKVLWPYPQKLKFLLGEVSHEVYPTFSSSHLVGIVWNGIFRKFGYQRKENMGT